MAPRYSIGVQTLYDLMLADHKRRYPNDQYPYIKKFKFTKANGLTAAIKEFLQLCGHQAERISVTGRMVDERKIVYDCLGHAHQIGSTKYIKSSMQVGSADLSATLAPHGRALKVEVKIGRDRQRDEQKTYQAQIEATGGIYLIVRDFDEFYAWYCLEVGEPRLGPVRPPKFRRPVQYVDDNKPLFP